MNKKELIISIDVGFTGGISYLFVENGKIKEVISYPMPIIKTKVEKVKKGKKRIYYKFELDKDKLWELLFNAKYLYNDNNIIYVIEVVHSFPKQGVVSTFNFGLQYGIILGMLYGKQIIFYHPNKWKNIIDFKNELIKCKLIKDKEELKKIRKTDVKKLTIKYVKNKIKNIKIKNKELTDGQADSILIGYAYYIEKYK